MSKREKQLTVADIARDIQLVAEAAGIRPQQVNKTVYNKFGGQYDEWQIRKLGNLSNIIKSEFADSEDLDLGAIQGVNKQKAYITRLRRELGRQSFNQSDMVAAFRHALSLQPIVVSSRPKRTPIKPRRHERENILHLSDLHFGINIDPFEVEHNQYNWQVAARRLACAVEMAAHYKLDHRKDCPSLVINFCGDLLAGIIHSDDNATDLITYQVVGAARYFIQAIDYLLDFYPRIRVITTPGNHDRLITLTKGKGRAVANKYDGFNTMLFDTVQAAFRREPRVEFVIPKTPYSTFSVFDRPFMSVHGDTVLSFGRPSRSIDTKKIAMQVNHINASLPAEQRIQVVLGGHVHTALHLALDNDTDLFINASMSGVDYFAQACGILRARVAQWLIESVREYRVGDTRLVDLARAADDPRFDKIIKPFDYSLLLGKV